MNISACGIFTLHPWEVPWGPRAPEAILFEAALQEQLTELIEQQQITDFWLVMDQGLSFCVAEKILLHRQSRPLRLTCVIPFEEQHIHWPEEDRDRYFSILEQCDREYLLSHHFSIDCYQQSVQVLLANCALLFVVWNERPGDACDAIQYAQRNRHHVRSLSIARLHSGD